MKLPYSVTEDIIARVRSIPKDRIVDMKNELQVAEPILFKWAKDSVKEEIREIRYSGVSMPSEESVKYVGSIILQAKIEGFLIGLMSQDREWSNRFLLDDHSSDIRYVRPVTALLEGQLDRKYYAEIEKTMTEDERKDITHWKNKALVAHKEFIQNQAALKKAATYLSKDDEPPSKTSPTPELGITP
jgi:hypothetical protein